MDSQCLTQVTALFEQPLLELIYQSHTVHRQHHEVRDIQKCQLLNIKTGGCPEDCNYCSQSVHYDTGLAREPLMQLDKVIPIAKKAKQQGISRFCMGAAWRQVSDGKQFERVLEIVRAVKAEGLEVCVTLGMLTEEQALRLKEAGVYAYNHNLDTSREFYPKIISTRTYDDRLKTIQHVRKAGMTVCSGGISGLGESRTDRCALIAELASLDPQPESVPINLLVAVEGTPQQQTLPLEPLELVRAIAVTRIMIPKARIRLSAGRASLTPEAQTLAFFAGANSLWLGDKLLTTPNPAVEDDYAFLAKLTGISADVPAPAEA
ncbi:MAG: biotin synthase BioB [Gammaproteobacteria bacterium]